MLSFEIPPLRQRGPDVLRLARHFCQEFSRVYGGRGEHRLAPGAEAELAAYSWPGNVRELRNVMERAVLLSSKGSIDREGIAQILRPSAPAAHNLPSSPGSGSRFTLPPEGIRLEELERELLVQALDLAQGNRTKAAKLLGLSRDTFRYRLEKYGIDRE